MINPEDNVPFDDSQLSEADDQQSQKDIHSNGLDETAAETEGEQETFTDMLEQAYDAAEPSYTLDIGDDDKKDDDNEQNEKS